MAEKEKMTRAEYEAREKELNYLQTEQRRENAARLSEAIGMGDLSENAEYDAAKEAQAETEARIVQLERMLKNVDVIENDQIRDDVVGIGTRVTIKDVATGKESTYKLYSSGDGRSTPLEGVLSTASPVGSAISNHYVGDVVKVIVPKGQMEYEIVKIEKINE